MQHYQLYRMTEAGIPLPGQEFAGFNDADALAVAQLMTGGTQAEVWQDTRWVGWINPAMVRGGPGGPRPRVHAH